MSSASRVTQFALFSLVLAAGCASTSGGWSRGRQDLHSSASIAGDVPHVLVSGPAWLMHVNVEGRDDLALYAVARKDGTDADCAGTQVGERKHLKPGVPNLVNLNVPEGAAICVRTEPDTRRATVMWHARRIDPSVPAIGREKALAFEEAGR
jgi:hypothetical protein